MNIDTWLKSDLDELGIGGEYRLIYELARPYLNTRQNDIHVRISLFYAVKLLEKEPGDPGIVLPAVILHDLGWWKIPEEEQLMAFGPKAVKPEINRLHELEGARMAREILEKVNYDARKTEEIVAIVEGHDSRKTAISQNDMLVKDADKLFRFSRLGFEIDAARFKVDRSWYRQWLGRCIDRWFFTATAKVLAREGWEQIQV